MHCGDADQTEDGWWEGKKKKSGGGGVPWSHPLHYGWQWSVPPTERQGRRGWKNMRRKRMRERESVGGWVFVIANPVKMNKQTMHKNHQRFNSGELHKTNDCTLGSNISKPPTTTAQQRRAGATGGREGLSDYPAPSLKMSVKIDFIYEI